MIALSKTEQATLRLIKDDLKFVHTVIMNNSISGSNHLVTFLPYFGMIINGCENWCNKVKALKKFSVKFSKEEQNFYSDLRNSIKLWEISFVDLLINVEKNTSKAISISRTAVDPLQKF